MDRHHSNINTIVLADKPVFHGMHEAVQKF